MLGRLFNVLCLGGGGGGVWSMGYGVGYGARGHAVAVQGPALMGYSQPSHQCVCL